MPSAPTARQMKALRRFETIGRIPTYSVELEECPGLWWWIQPSTARGYWCLRPEARRTLKRLWYEN